MKTITLTLVVPFYNAKMFIRDCLGSVAAQYDSRCEVILVDDGSTDCSEEIIRTEFMAEMEKGFFNLIRIQNSGPGEARNVGIKSARGRYIGFLDSDDILLPGYFETILDLLDQYQPDIIEFNCTRFKTGQEDKSTPIPIHRNPPGLYELCEIRNDIFGMGKWFPCARVFLKEVLMSHPFPREKVFYEDLLTLPFIFFQDWTIYLHDQPLVAYRDNESGTTRNHQPEHAEIMLGLVDKLLQLPSSLAKDALLVQLVRGIIYFAMELRLTSIPVDGLLDVIVNMRSKSELQRYLGFADSVLLRFPRLYVYGERARMLCKRLC